MTPVYWLAGHFEQVMNGDWRYQRALFRDIVLELLSCFMGTVLFVLIGWYLSRPAA